MNTILKMIMLSINRESISKSHRHKAILNLRHLIPSKNTTRGLGSIKRKLMTMTLKISHIPAIKMIQRTIMKRKKTHHQNIMLNTLIPQNHRMNRMKKRMKKKKKALNTNNAKKPMQILTKGNPNNINITEKISSRNLKNLIGKSFQNTVRRIYK